MTESLRPTPDCLSVLDALPDGVVVHDADGSIIAFNARAPELLGLSADQFRGHAAIDPLWRVERLDGTPIDQAELPTNVARLTGRVVEETTFWLRVGDAPRRLIAGSASPLEICAPVPCAVVVTFRDVTEAWLVSEQAKRLDALSTIIELSFDGIVVIDAEEHIQLANPAFARLLRAEDVGRMVGRDFTLVVAAAQRPEFVKRFRSLVETEVFDVTDARTHRFAVSLVTDSGTAVPTELSMARMMWRGAPAIVCVARDDSARRQLEAEVRQLQKVEAIGAFAMEIAHDFANVLQVIRGAARTFEKGSVEGATKDAHLSAVENLNYAIGRGTEMTRHLLAFVRREPRTPERIDSCEEIRVIAGMLRRLLPGRVVLSLDLAADVGLLSVHRTELEQVLMNLVVNARNAMGDAGSIVIRTVGLTNNRLQIDVVDDGPGISFSPDDEASAGSGLGLSIVRRIVDGAAGEFVIASGPNGTTCRINLPTAPLAAGTPVGMRYVSRFEAPGTVRR